MVIAIYAISIYSIYLMSYTISIDLEYQVGYSKSMIISYDNNTYA